MSRLYTPTTTAITQAAGDNTTLIATDAFVTTAVNNGIAGVNPAVAVQAATTSASNTSSLTYNNGVSGIGATLTGANNVALTVDGYTFTALGQRLLVKNDTQSPSGAFNGVYYVTQVQASILPLILTRALDYDQSSDINNTGAIPVVNGTTNALTSWLLTSSVTTVGTDPLTYTKFSINPITQLTTTLTSAHLLVGNSSNIATDTSITGDITITNAGVTSLASSISGAKTFSGIFSPTAGIAPINTGFTAFGTGGMPNVLNATSGTVTSAVAGTLYWAAVFIPMNTLITGVVYTTGTSNGAGNVIGALYDATGALVSNSALAGTAVSGSSVKQKLTFVGAGGTTTATGPSTYYIVVQFSATTAKFMTFSNTVEGFVTGSTTGTFGTLPSITPGTTYSASVGPFASTY